MYDYILYQHHQQSEHEFLRELEYRRVAEERRAETRQHRAPKDSILSRAIRRLLPARGNAVVCCDVSTS